MVTKTSKTIQQIKRDHRIPWMIALAIVVAIIPMLLRTVVLGTFPVGTSDIAGLYTLALWGVHVVGTAAILGVNLAYYFKNERDQLRGTALSQRTASQWRWNIFIVWAGLLLMGLVHFAISQAQMSQWSLVMIAIEYFTGGVVEKLATRLLPYILFLILSASTIVLDVLFLSASNVKAITKQEQAKFEQL